MRHYEDLKEAMSDNNFNTCLTMVVGKHIMTFSIDKEKWCIFHYENGLISDIKYYDDIIEPNGIMMDFAKKECL